MPFNFSQPYNGLESAELVLQPATLRPALRERFSVVEGLKGKKQVTTLKRTRKVTRRDPGCGQGKQQLTLTDETDIWDPQDVKIWFYECWKDLRGKVLEWKLRTGNDKPDISNTENEDYLIEVLNDAAYEDLIRLGWFGKKAITAAMLTRSSDVEHYNAFDGVWEQVFRGVSATSIVRVNIADNAGLSTDDQELEDGGAYPIFRNMMNNSSYRLKSTPRANMQLFASDSIMTDYLNFRESQNLDTSFQVMESGITTLRYRGVPITLVPEWDEFIESDFKISGKYDLPNRALLTTKGNLQIGFDSEPYSAQGQDPMKIWFSDDTELWNAKLLYMADTKVADKGLITAAY